MSSAPSRISQQAPSPRCFPHRVAPLPCGIYAIGSAFFLFSGSAGRQAAPLIGALFCGAVWISVRHLSLCRLGLVTGLFLKGPFRRIIDLHSRLDELEQSLAHAGDIEECWDTIQLRCREFGFYGGRLNVRGRVFESAALPAGLERQWQLRVPLAEGQYLNLYRDPEAEDHPAILGRLTGILRDGLHARLAGSKSEVRSLTAAGR
jgi:hypothetical protein